MMAGNLGRDGDQVINHLLNNGQQADSPQVDAIWNASNPEAGLEIHFYRNRSCSHRANRQRDRCRRSQTLLQE